MPASNMPVAEIDIDARLVRALIAEQFPALSHLDVAPAAYGWDNVVVRVGDDLVARLPRRAIAVPNAENEHRWLPLLAPRLPLPVPAPIHLGRPGFGYPWAWAICPWLEGDIAAHRPPSDPAAAAASLGGFLRALHEPAPAEAPPNPVRGGPLEQRTELLERGLVGLGAHVDGDGITGRWRDALSLPAWSRAPVWVHGDLHPANLLVSNGRLSAVIDFGDLTAGDPAGDLSVAWMLFPTDARARAALRDASGHDDATWQRGRAWALALSVAFIANSADHATIAAIGERTLASALADWPTEPRW